jgi:hypothetical protein
VRGDMQKSHIPLTRLTSSLCSMFATLSRKGRG